MLSSNIILDSSCWIEILTGGPLSKDCERYLHSTYKIYIPTLVLFEVYKKICSLANEDQALSAISYLSRNQVIDLNREAALLAGDLSIEHKLAMADSIIYAHTLQLNAKLITKDFDFKNLPNVFIIK